MNWFNVDKAGLAALVERRGKAFVVNELVQNAWDSGADRVSIELTPIDGEPFAKLTVEDLGDGFENLEDARTMFSRSRRAGDATKRGRFGLGEKLVLACCREARIDSSCGSIIFRKDGSVSYGRGVSRERGTRFDAEIRMTRSELDHCLDAAGRLITPIGVATTVNGRELVRPPVFRQFDAKLPTEIAGEDGALRRSTRFAMVEVFSDYRGEATGMLYELGVPVVETDWAGWKVNVQQKVPLNFERDNVTPAFLKALGAMLLNAVHDAMSPEESTASWVGDAVGDARATSEAVKAVIENRFGPRAVAATPGDPLANAAAAASGYTVVSGGALSADAWSNVKKFGAIVPASRAFPTPTPAQLASARDAAASTACPICGRPIN